MSARRILVSIAASLGVLGGIMCLAGSAAAAGCPNEEFRTGPSASLPDCRAYELVTAENLASSQDTPFTGETEHAIPSADGEHLAMETYARLEPEPTVLGSLDVFSRTSTGWTVKSATAPGAGAQLLELKLLSPELSQVALQSYTSLNSEEQSPRTFEVGPVGGPYAPVAEVPSNYLVSTELVGANAGTPSVPAFSDVLFVSPDPAVLPAGTERTVAEQTLAGRSNLYEWAGGRLRLVGVNGEGKLLSLCGSTLASGSHSYGDSRNAISADGSKIFFTAGGSGPNCEVPGGLYMRVAGSSEPVEVSAPQDVKLTPSEHREVVYMGATPDGSEVFFATGEALTKDAPDDGQPNLYEYNTEAPTGGRLTFIANGVETRYLPRWFVVSEDGSTVYYGFDDRYYRYDTRTKETSFVATPGESKGTEEAAYTTPNGAFFVFPAGGVEGEPRDRGAGEPNWGPYSYGYNGLFRYDNADKSVACVSCGSGLLPAPNFENGPTTNVMVQPVGGFGQGGEAVLKTSEATPAFVDMSDSGQQVFFQTTAQLVPQDTNSTVFEEATVGGAPGLDVYEWEADGANGCTASLGCTYLLSGGGDTGASVFLGASKDGSNVFFASAAPLLPQATPEFTSIYDARVDGGFPPPRGEPECLSCQGVGAPSPLFSTPASETFVGAGNAAASEPVAATSTKSKTKTKTVKCGKRKGRCVEVKVKHGKKVKRASRGARR